MKTNVENLRIGAGFCHNHRVKFKRAVIWSLSFFAVTGLRTQSQQIEFPTNALPNTSTTSTAPPEVSSNSIAPSEISTNQVQQTQHAPTPLVPSGVMSWPSGQSPASPNQPLSKPAEGVMPWPGAQTA